VFAGKVKILLPYLLTVTETVVILQQHHRTIRPAQQTESTNILLHMTAIELATSRTVLRDKLSYYETKNRRKAETLSRELKALNGYLRRGHIVKYYAKQRDINDQRRKVAKAIFAYYGSDGFEYRKSFIAPVNTPENEFYRIAPETIASI
jgi:hypothetical protein